MTQDGSGRSQCPGPTGSIPSSLLWGPPSPSPEGVSALPRGLQGGERGGDSFTHSQALRGWRGRSRIGIGVPGSRKKKELWVSWPPPLPPQPLPAPLFSLPGSLPPPHTQQGWLCSHPQLPGSLDLLGRAACHPSCSGSGPGGGVHLAKRERGRDGGERGCLWAASDSWHRPERTGWESRAAWLAGQVSLFPFLSFPDSFPGGHVTPFGGDSGWLGNWAPWHFLGTRGGGDCRGRPFSPPAPPPPSAAPRPAPSAGRPSRSLPTSGPRSGRLLVPRPQSLFDPLLGSEPCDPVGGPRSQAASAARLSCWVSPRSLCSLQPRTACRGPSGGPAARQPPRGPGGSSAPPGAPGSSPPTGGTAPGPQERDGGISVFTRGPDFRARSRREGLCVPQPCLCKYLASYPSG